jgi:indole-3-acetate monooxygenase
MTNPAPALLETARGLAPMLSARAGELDAARRLPADLAATLASAGFMRMALPKAHGGLELAPAAIIETVEALAAANASVAWCVMIAATTAVNAAYLPQAHARTIWADPNVIVGGVFAPRGNAVRDGDEWVVSGRWPWASGSANCGWLGVGALCRDGEGPPQPRLLWLPAHQASLIDTWDALGMRGTGSGDLALDAVRVPLDRSTPLAGGTVHEAGPLYAFPLFGLLALAVASVALGNARGALDELATLAGVKAPVGSRKLLGERAHTQIEFARAEGMLAGARAAMLSIADSAYAHAADHGALDLATRARIRIAAVHAARTSAEVCRIVHDLAGGTGVYETGPFPRRFRDAHVATQHVMVSPAALELAGRALLEQPGDYAQL